MTSMTSHSIKDMQQEFGPGQKRFKASGGSGEKDIYAFYGYNKLYKDLTPSLKKKVVNEIKKDKKDMKKRNIVTKKYKHLINKKYSKPITSSKMATDVKKFSKLLSTQYESENNLSIHSKTSEKVVIGLDGFIYEAILMPDIISAEEDFDNFVESRGWGYENEGGGVLTLFKN